jgi:hypothetical protein
MCIIVFTEMQHLQSLFEQEGIIHNKYEFINDIGLIIGGSEDQSLHHDIARNFSYWANSSKISEDGIYQHNGWEVNRLDYNEAMSSPFAPSSILIGVGHEENVYLGIQRDQINYHG